MTCDFSAVICIMPFQVKRVQMYSGSTLAFLMTRTWLRGGLKFSCRVVSVNVCDDRKYMLFQTIFTTKICNHGITGTSYLVTCDGPRASQWARATLQIPSDLFQFWDYIHQTSIIQEYLAVGAVCGSWPELSSQTTEVVETQEPRRNIHGTQQTEFATKLNLLERKKPTPQNNSPPSLLFH